MAKKTKAAKIREYLQEHPEATPSDVAAAVSTARAKVTNRDVSAIKYRMKNEGASPAPDSAGSKKKARKARPKAKPKPKPKPKVRATAKGTPWRFPKHTLEDALSVPKAIEEKHAGAPVRAADLARMLEFNQPKDWRFLDLVRSANQYGLVEGSGAAATIKLLSTGSDIVAPSSAPQRQKALVGAFEAVDLFKQVRDHYGGKRLPDDEYLANTLARDFGVSRDRVDAFIKTFTENVTYLKSFAADVGSARARPDETQDSNEKTATGFPAEATEVREFLDSCFVLMPFGDWFDTYYRDIYLAAIKDAGFEPVRADDLFETGSVMEQIWTQIRKAKVLLADLTGKNPNVFYELGLAHALRKPVVFVAATIDDVPFDLRHLRIVLYDVRSPNWAAQVRTQITTYLKNTRSEPEKSIPQPFRDSSPSLEGE